jgi:hypothetical protein
MLIIIVSRCLRACDSVDMGLGTDYPSPNRRIKDDAKSCAKRRVITIGCIWITVSPSVHNLRRFLHSRGCSEIKDAMRLTREDAGEL